MDTEQTEQIEVTGLPVMPDWVRQRVMKINKNPFIPAVHRIAWWRSVHPEHRFAFTVLEGGQNDKFAVVQATIFNGDGELIAQGTKSETMQDFPGGWIEKAETGALCRALAFLGFGITESAMEAGALGGGPSDGTPYNPQRSANSGGGKGRLNNTGRQCPECNAPNGKMHSASCPA